MKELSIEEKAKAYDEAKARMSRAFNSNRCTIGFMNEIFPELKESEDEKIREYLIRYIDNTMKSSGLKSKLLAWLEKQGESYTKRDVDDAYVEGMAFAKDELEKQGEQKPTDGTEPKFKNGQWIVWQDKYYKVNDNYCRYELVDQNGLSTSLEYGTIDENAHLWDITKDAKDGDALVHNSITFIFKGIEDGIVKGLCSELTDFILYFSEPEHDKDYYPATKEQRDLLFQKMKEAGYSWDAEKKELKKIELKDAWSEEFERMCQETIDWFEKKCFPYALENDNPARESIKWLKSLKQRIRGEQ